MVCRLPGPSELLRATGARPEVVTALKDVGMPAGQMCVLWTKRFSLCWGLSRTNLLQQEKPHCISKVIFACWCRDLSFQRGSAGCGTRLCRRARRGRHGTVRPVLEHGVLLPLLGCCLPLLPLLSLPPLLLLLPLLPGFHLVQHLDQLCFLTSPASPAPPGCGADPPSTGSPPRAPPCSAQFTFTVPRLNEIT